MVPIIYPHNNINFKTLGKGKITGASRCIVHEELNGDYSSQRSGNIWAILLGISPLKMALRAYCVAVGRML